MNTHWNSAVAVGYLKGRVKAKKRKYIRKEKGRKEKKT